MQPYRELVDEFALAGTRLDGLAIRPFSPRIPVMVRAVTGERQVIVKPAQVFIDAMSQLMPPIDPG